MVKFFLRELTDCIFDSNSFIKEVLISAMNMDEQSISIERTDFGKPYLKDYPNVHFNLSHTKDMAILAIYDKAIGIDIEKIKEFNRRIPIKFFSDNEKYYVFKNDKNQNIRFFEIWTKKEAFVKWTGKGMSTPFNSFDTTIDKRISTIIVGDHIISFCTENNSELKYSLVFC